MKTKYLSTKSQRRIKSLISQLAAYMSDGQTSGDAESRGEIIALLYTQPVGGGSRRPFGLAVEQAIADLCVHGYVESIISSAEAIADGGWGSPNKPQNIANGGADLAAALLEEAERRDRETI
jgi:hypothetical protein